MQSPPVPASQPETRLLDTEQLLQQMGDADAMRDMLVMFQEALAHDVPAIAERLQTGDVLAANHLLHGLKGIVPIFCQGPVSEEVKRLELMSKTAQADKLAELTQAYAPLQRRLDQLLAEVTAALSN